MANFFVDTGLAVDGDGTTTDLAANPGETGAWNSIETAMEYNGFTPGDKTWIKRDSSYTCAGAAAHILPADDGTPAAPLYFIGWPRQVILNISITQADFTNGSTIIDNVVGITPTRESHIGRYITAPDGEKYMITAVLWEASLDGTVAAFTLESKLTNSTQTEYGKVWGWSSPTIQYVRSSASAWVEDNALADAVTGTGDIDASGETAVGFLIDKEYAGSTVTGTDGKFQIEADDDYTEAQAIDDSAWTIKLSTWSDDADTLPVIDFANYASYIYVFNDLYYSFSNLEFRDSTAYIIYFRGNGITSFCGCLFHNDNNEQCTIIQDSNVYFKRTIFEGTLIGTGQSGIVISRGTVYLKDVAIYGMGDNGITATDSYIFIDGLNNGIEMGNGDDDIYAGYFTRIEGKDIKLGALNNAFQPYMNGHLSRISIENYNRVLGAHKILNAQGDINKVTAGAGGDIANARSGGATSLVEINYNRNVVNYSLLNPISEWTCEVFSHEFEATTDSKSYRYYVQSMAILTAAQLWIEVEYVNSYDDTTEYTFATQKSDETFTVRADADDWAEYMEVTGIEPAIGSKVRIKCYCSYYHATNKIYIDPMCVIS